MKLKRLYIPGLEGKQEGLVLYGPTRQAMTAGYSVVILAGGNTSVVVPNRYATPSFLRLWTTKEDWILFDQKVYDGGWNTLEDCPWPSSHERTFIFDQDDGRPVFHYGYSRTQSPDFPDKELWYVKGPTGECVIVEKKCTDKMFMLMFGPHWERWYEIAWGIIPYDPNVPINSREWPLTAQTPPYVPKFNV